MTFEPEAALPVRRLKRAERREQILDAAISAFSRTGYAATSLDDVAAAAGISRAILYRHFESKAQLYRQVLDRVRDRLDAETGHGRYTEEAVDGLVSAASKDPDGFRLLFDHAMREPEFAEEMRRFRTDMTDVAYRYLSEMVTDPAWAKWAAQLSATTAIGAVMAWLDAGRPDPELVGDRIRHAIGGVIDAARAQR
ncbi:TetR/AcrR family transcriptional regulator [Glycomyces tarimensis]